MIIEALCSFKDYFWFENTVYVKDYLFIVKMIMNDR